LSLEITGVWVFSGNTSRPFPGGIFTTREKASKWIKANHLSGTLTLYPLDVGADEWAISRQFFTPRKPREFSPQFISGFSDASMEHFHYESGECREP
jgi:hypothetical protein